MTCVNPRSELKLIDVNITISNHENSSDPAIAWNLPFFFVALTYGILTCKFNL